MTDFEVLEDVLMIGDIVFRCKQFDDKRLNSFLAKESNLSRLLSYALEPISKEDCNVEVEDMVLKDKFPYVAGEVLRSTIGRRLLMPRVCKNKKLLGKLFSIIYDDHSKYNSKGENENLICFYGRQFCRLLTSFIKNDSTKGTMLEMLYNEGHLMKFVDHIAVLPEMGNLIVLSLNTEDIMIDEPLEEKQKVVDKIIRSLENIKMTEYCSMLLISMLNSNACKQLVSDQFEKFLATIFNIADEDYEFSESLRVIKEIIINPPEGHDEAVMKSLLGFLPKFIDMLKKPLPSLDQERKEDEFPMRMGDSKLGILSILEMIVTRSPKYSMDYTERISMIVKCFICDFMWKMDNQIGYSHITNCITFCLQKKILKDLIFDKSELIRHIATSFRKSVDLLKSGKKTLSNIPFLFEMGYYLDDLTKSDKSKFGYTVDGFGSPYFGLFEEELKRLHFMECVFRCGGDLIVPAKFKGKGTLLKSKIVKKRFQPKDEEEESGEEDTSEEEEEEEKKEEKDSADDVVGFWNSEDVRKKEKMDDFDYFFE